MLKLRDPSIYTSPDQLAMLESHLGFTLPQDYRAFLLDKNGGKVEEGGVVRDIADGTKVTRIARFLSLSSTEFESIERCWKDLESRVPEQHLPIAEDAGGNVLLLNCMHEDGGVFFGDLESLEERSCGGQSAALPKVAASFSSLLLAAAEH